MVLSSFDNTGLWREATALITSVVFVCCLASASRLSASAQTTSAQTTSVQTPSAQTNGPTSQKVTPPDATEGEDTDYRIGPDDVIDIKVYNSLQLSRDGVRISARGTINMPLIEQEIQAACKSAKELGNDISRIYLDYLRNPQVYVSVKEYKSKPVAVLGAVNTPGQFLLQRRVRLLEMLALAGGFRERAGNTIQVVHTGGLLPCESHANASQAEVADNSESVYYLSLSETLRGDPKSIPYVQPGDVITVLEADQAYVVGNVLRPTNVALKEDVTVTQAIAMAGGIMPDTRSNKVRIIRKGAGHEGKTEIFVDLKAIEKRQADDIALKANDIVDVPASGGKRFLRSLVGTIAPTISQLPVRVVP
jgi:polysaccharide export outer membrane protein